MAYVNPKDPYAPKHRRDVAAKARRIGVRAASRYYGIPPGTISKWMKKARKIGYHPIPTRSSRPKAHPNELKGVVVQKIISKRIETKRCAEVVHRHLTNEGVHVSLSSVKRTLDRTGLTKKRSPWKRYHPPQERPQALTPGDLVQIDTIHLWKDGGPVVYIYTLIDVFSRWVYVKAVPVISCRETLVFVEEAQEQAPFQFNHLQTDHGPEFSTHFTERVGIKHRHSRVRKPNDNAHLERFNRTLQDECLDGVSLNVESLNEAIALYIPHYNNARLHLGINLLTPNQLLTV